MISGGAILPSRTKNLLKLLRFLKFGLRLGFSIHF
jgi:hypothetical protein